MPQIKDVTWSVCSLIDYLFSLRDDVITVSKQRNRIEVAHHTNIMAHSIPSLIESHTPVETNYVTASFSHQFEKSSGAGSEVNHGDSRSDSLNHIPSVRQDKLSIIVGAQTADPGIK